MKKRDRYLLLGVGGFALVAAFWMFALSPKLKSLKDVKKDVSTAQSALADARAQATKNAQARLDFPHTYAEMARLGKSVPVNSDEAALIYQLHGAANRSNVHFTSLTLDSTGGESAGGTPTPAPAPAPSAGGAQAASAPAGSQTTPPPTDDTLGAVAADAVVTASAPAGSTTGPADLRVMHFTLEFEGPFYRLENFLRHVKRLTWSNRKDLLVSGRLVSIDGITFDTTGDHVTISATTYLLPTSQGLFAGASPAGPAGTQSGAQPASSSGSATAPPTAAVRP